MNIRNCQYNIYNTIDCEIEHPLHGWINLTASPNDVADAGRNIYQQIIDQEMEIKDYVPLPEPTTEEYNLIQKELRQDAYTKITDPLFFKYQRGEIEKQEWLDKIEEIKQQYAYKQ